MNGGIINSFTRLHLVGYFYLVTVGNGSSFASLLLTLTLAHLSSYRWINRLNAELNTICHFLALLRAHLILHVSRIRVKGVK